MSTKRKVYSADFKAKLVLEVLEREQTISCQANSKTGQLNFEKCFILKLKPPHYL